MRHTWRRTLVSMSTSGTFPPEQADDRITHLHGRYPLGPLGRAIADGGGPTLSVDSSGAGVVLVGTASSRAEPVAGPARGSSSPGLAAIRERLATTGLVWWVLVAIIAIAAAAVAWFGPTGAPQRSSSPAHAPAPGNPEPTAPAPDPRATLNDTPRAAKPARSRRAKPKPTPTRPRRSQPASGTTPARPAPVAPATPAAPPASYTPPRARPQPQPAPPQPGGGAPPAELVPVH